MISDFGLIFLVDEETRVLNFSVLNYWVFFLGSGSRGLFAVLTWLSNRGFQALPMLP